MDALTRLEKETIQLAPKLSIGNPLTIKTSFQIHIVIYF